MSDTPYVPNDPANLVARLRETRDAARFRMMQSPGLLRDLVIWERDPDEWTVAAQIEVLCSRLSEAALALELAEVDRNCLRAALRVAQDDSPPEAAPTSEPGR